MDASQCTHPASMRGVGGGGAGLNGGAAGLKEVVETVMSTAIPSEARPSPPSGGGGRSPLPKGLSGLSQVAMLEATDGRSSSRGLSAARRSKLNALLRLQRSWLPVCPLQRSFRCRLDSA